MTRAHARWPGVVALAVALVFVGMLGGWRLAGDSRTDTELGRVSFGLEPALGGGVQAYVPVADWGLRADAFDAPFRLQVELRSLNRSALLRAAEGDGSVLRAAEDDVREAARSAVIRAFAWGAALSLLLLAGATLVWRGLRPRWALAAAGGVVLAFGTALSLWSALARFDADVLENPTYYGRGKELVRILEVAENERVASGYGSEFTSILRSVSAVLTDAALVPEAPGRDLYLASDLHANALAIEPLSRLFGNEPLLLAGDFGQRGNEAESALLAPRVAALGSRVVAVSGNHDSRRLMGRLAALGVTVLGADGRLGASGEYTGSALLEVDGLLVAGFPDPFEYAGDHPDSPDRPITFDQLPDGEEAQEEAESALLAWFDSLPRRPDIVMVHQNRLAQAMASALREREQETAEGRRPLTIVTGDDHVQHVDRYGATVVVDGGTVGAGGIFDAGREPIGFAQLHFEADRPALRSVDLVAVEPFSGSARASRIVIGTLCPETGRCTVEPEDLDAPDLSD